LGSAERSERELALGRRTARRRRIDRLCVPAEVRENPLDRCGRLDAGNHTKAAAAAPARLDLDGEYPLEALARLNRLSACSAQPLTAPRVIQTVGSTVRVAITPLIGPTIGDAVGSAGESTLPKA